MRNLTLLLGAGLSLFAGLSMNAQMAQITPLIVAEQMPYFPGCADKTLQIEEKRSCSNQILIHFIKDNMIYPETAKNDGIEGTVIVKFVVDEIGKLTDFEIVKNIGGGCGEAALDVLRRMPLWEPAIHHGTPAKVELTLPIHFSLAEATPDVSKNYHLAWGNIYQTQVTKAQLVQNVKENLYVRDELGNHLLVDELIFSFLHKSLFGKENHKEITAKSRGDINRELAKIIEKSKKGGELHIRASVQDKGQFFYVGKIFEIVE